MFGFMFESVFWFVCGFLTVCVSVFSLKGLFLSKISFLCAQDFLGGVSWER